MTGALDGIRVLDLSRIFAGPTCTQLLGDMGADVIKIENPATGGDDTRSWGPPYVAKSDGTPSDLSAYFNCANRNKRSVAIDIVTPEGQDILHRLAQTSDVVIENFTPGGLKKYRLDYESLKRINPALVYCSISGFGQTGPNAHKSGYDLMAQGYGGIMSLTGEPMKVGVGIADVKCGMYSSSAILAALLHRERTGEGQHIDIALVDTQIAWLINQGTNYLTSGERPERHGNGHPNIAPYQVYATSDAHVIVAVGNDGQFGRFCQFLGIGDLAGDPRFATNPMRLQQRQALNDILEPLFSAMTAGSVVSGLEAAGVPVGPVNTLPEVFASDQVAARQMKIEMMSDAIGSTAPLIANPVRFSHTPVNYRYPPPVFGEHKKEVLSALRQSKHGD